MADCIVQPRIAIVKCKTCGTMYVPNRERDRRWSSGNFYAFEKCPVCGQDDNDYDETIPLWKYNLIRYFRFMRWGKS